MLLFATPLWLWALPAVTALGAWALWRGRNRPRPISSIRLWQGVIPAPATRRRRIDPIWLMVWIASLLATAALAGPAWTGHSLAEVPSADMEWAIRSLGASTAPIATEAHIRLRDGKHLPQQLLLSLETDAGTEQRGLSLTQARDGIDIPFPPTAARATLSLRAQTAPTATPPLAQATFARPAIGEPFALLGAAAADAALQRVFAIQPQAHPDDPTIGPAVLLLSDPATAASTLAALRSPALIIAEPEVPLPGLTPGDHLSTSTPWTPAIPAQQNAAMPSFVHFDHVHISALRTATLSPEWHILATAGVGGKPWIGLRQQNQLTMIWLASHPSTETDWPKDPSFVLFFADTARQALAQDTTAPSTRFTDWQPLPNSPATSPPTPTPLYPLTPYLGIAAILLLVSTTLLLASRTRPRQNSSNS